MGNGESVLLTLITYYLAHGFTKSKQQRPEEEENV